MNASYVIIVSLCALGCLLWLAGVARMAYNRLHGRPMIDRPRR